ncbi:hypothetical protein ACFE04_014147 [Oxalis oulophora]
MQRIFGELDLRNDANKFIIVSITSSQADKTVNLVLRVVDLYLVAFYMNKYMYKFEVYDDCFYDFEHKYLPYPHGDWKDILIGKPNYKDIRSKALNSISATQLSKMNAYALDEAILEVYDCNENQRTNQSGVVSNACASAYRFCTLISEATRISSIEFCLANKQQNKLDFTRDTKMEKGLTSNGVFFAVKEVPLLNQGNQSIDLLEQQIAMLSQFEHENIVLYYGTQRDESTLHIFLELMTRDSLVHLYQQSTLSESQVSTYTRQILHGLKYLHDQHVVHRDIKCANILVHANGSLKLADFGLAKAGNLNDYRRKGAVVNRRGQGYDLPADIWSRGCTVLEMLTGRAPYSEFECMAALFKISKGNIPIVPISLSNCAQAFIIKCLKANPNDRPTASELLDHPFVRITLP